MAVEKSNLLDAIINVDALSEGINSILSKTSSYAKALEAKNRLEKEKLEKELSKKLSKATKEEQEKLVEEVAKKKNNLDIQYQEKLTELQEKEDKKRHLENLKNANTVAGVFIKVGENLGKAAVGAAKALGSSVEKYLGTYTKYFSLVESRLQGSGINYRDINKVISEGTSFNPFLTYSDVLENASKFVEEGVTNNITQRAFLATIANKIAGTFNAFDSNILRLIRIQGQDTTASRLGLEASLTNLFNTYFGDTSYLSHQFDNVQATLTEVSAQLGAYAGVEFEYAAQKWLGALGASGVSDSTLSTIAQGLQYLGTGNINALSGNTSLQNLMVMAMNRSGSLNYGDVLAGGLNASQANILLNSLVGYIREIAQTPNNVVRAQYAELFGISMSDMIAFSNMQEDTIQSLYKTTVSYNDTLTELQNQLGQVASRTHLSEMIDNVFENILTTTGMNVANSAAAYGIYKAADMLESITGGIELPFLMTLGTGMDLNMSLEKLVKAGVIGFGAISSLISGMENIFGGNLLNLDRWKIQSSGGKGFSGVQGGALSTVSGVTYVSSTSDTGIQQSLVDQQKGTGEEIMGTSKESLEDTTAILKFLYEYFREGGDNADSPLKVRIENGAIPINVKVDDYGLFSTMND